MIEATWELIIVIIGIALIFDFTNGFHDSANSISTVVSTKVLSPRNAVVFAAFFNFIAAFGFGVAVASTISKIIQLKLLQTAVIPYHHPRSPYRGNLLEPDHLVLRASHIIVPCPYRGTDRGWDISSRTCSNQMVHGRARSPSSWSSPRLSVLPAGSCLWQRFSTLQKKPTSRQQRSISSGFSSVPQLRTVSVHGTNDAQKTMGIIVPLLFSIGYFGAAVDPNHLPVPYLGDPASLTPQLPSGPFPEDGGSSRPWDTRSPTPSGAWVCR